MEGEVVKGAWTAALTVTVVLADTTRQAENVADAIRRIVLNR